MDYEKLKLLSVEEVEKLYYSSTDDEKKEIIFYCSDDLKLSEVNVLNDTDIVKFIMSFKDVDKRKQCFYKYFENSGKLVLWLITLFNNCNNSDIEVFVNLFFDYVLEKSFYVFSCYEVSKLLEFFNDGDKKVLLDRFMKVLEKSSKNIDVVGIGLDELINLFPLDDRISIFNKFLSFNFYNKSSSIGGAGIHILRFLDNNKRFEFLTFLLDNDLLNDSRIFSEMFECFTDGEKDDILIFIQDYEVKNNKKVLDYEKMALCLGKYDSNIRLEKFRTLVMYNDKYNHFDVINNLVDVKFKFDALNLKVESLYNEVFFKGDAEEKKRVLFDVLNVILNRHFEIWENKFPDGSISYDGLIDFYVVYLGLNRNNLVKFIERFGYVALRYLESDKVRSVINLDSKKFDLFLNLFRDDNLRLDNDTYNTVINAILQREFMVQCSDDYNIFARLQELINNFSFVELEKEILNMADVTNIKKMLLKYNLDINEFLEKLVNGDKGMLDILHEITNQYIMGKREFYVKERMKTVNDELDLNKKYEKNFIKKKWIATTSFEDILGAIICISDNGLTEEQLFLKNNLDILEMIIKFKKGSSGYVLEEKYKKYLKVFDSLLDILYESDNLKDPTNDPNAKYVYSAKNIELYTLIDFISELDINKIDKFLLSDETLLSSLDEILSKYKFLGWGITFSALKDSADFDFSNSSLVGLFDYFYKINSEVMNTDDKKFSLTKGISLANCYASSSSKYGLLFGEDVFKLIAANEGKNKASMIRYKRLQLAVEHLKGMYNREFIPVPPMDRDIEIDNGKKINVVVGNITSMNNLVLGEMTNSCMRIGGAFYDFYKECLEGTAGFNIVFTEPETNKFISRVSGIRNGNTLFLNELRSSEHEGYSDKDLCAIMYSVSQRLINASKSSKYPIDNVVITPAYAMQADEYELIDLHLADRNEAVFGLSHNLDASGKAILLASSNNDGKLVDINLGRDKISYYRPQRGHVKRYYGEDAVRRCVQMKMIQELLIGISLEDINIDMDLYKDVDMCIGGDDWLAIKYNNGYVEAYALFLSGNWKVANEEMLNYVVYSNDDMMYRLVDDVVSKDDLKEGKTR